MVGRAHRPGGLYALGLAELVGGDALAREASRGLTVHGDDAFEADFPDQHLLYRSDQISFIRAGIPGVLLTSSGFHDDYHAPSDEAPTVDPDHLARVAGLVRALVRDVADGALTFELARTPEAIMAEWHLRPEG